MLAKLHESSRNEPMLTTYRKLLNMLTSALFKSASRCPHQVGNGIALHEAARILDPNEFSIRPRRGEKRKGEKLAGQCEMFWKLRLKFTLMLCRPLRSVMLHYYIPSRLFGHEKGERKKRF
jgi:hypothetical protein